MDRHNYLQNQNDISEVAFNVWISCIEPYTIEDGNVVVFVKPVFSAKSLMSTTRTIMRSLQPCIGFLLGLKILSRDELSADSPAAEECGDPETFLGRRARLRILFENFMSARQTSSRTPRPGRGQQAGGLLQPAFHLRWLGGTHLLYAICNEIARTCRR